MRGDGTRNLLPPILGDADDFFDSDDDPSGAVMRPGPFSDSEAPTDDEDGEAPAAEAAGEEGQATPPGAAAGFAIPPTGPGGGGGHIDQAEHPGHGPHFGPIKVAIDIPHAKAHVPHSHHHAPAPHVSHHHTADDKADTVSADHDHDAGQGAIEPAAAGGPVADEDAADGVNSVTVTQYADVHQDASIEVTGYVGEVVARLHIDQDLVMDQDVDIAFTIDGDGHFQAVIDQDMRIDQSIDIDVKIWDADGVLYLDVYLKDAVSVEQDTDVDMHIGNGDPGGSVAIDQDVELDQDVDIDIDMADDLALRYAVTVDVDVTQQVYADQQAAVDVKDWHGDVEMDVDATQTALIEQHTLVHADFALV